MDTGEHRLRSVGALVALVASPAIWLSGCALPASLPPGPPATPVVSIAIDRAPVEPRPAPESPARESPAPAAATVAVLYSGSVPAQAAIAERIAVGLAGPAYTVRRIDIDGLDRAAPIAPIEADARIAAAVGPGALEVAQQRFANAEIVFSQVLETGYETGSARHIRGVAPIPTPAFQLEAWAAVDPGLERIGLITSERFAATVEAARHAAETVGAELVHRLSTSDRETLYLFRRLAPAIDGLWLAPDSEILSTAAIQEMLAHAAELDIGVLVFSETLLDRGGLISVAAAAEHVAATVVDAIEAIRTGGAAALPAEIPLGKGSVRVNAHVAAKLGLPEPPVEWVILDGR